MTERPSIALREAAARITDRAAGVLLTVSRAQDAEQRRALATFMRILIQQASTLERWANASDAGRRIPENWRDTVTEALELCK